MSEIALPKRNPAFYCSSCEKYIGHRGFCSKSCHDEYYNNIDTEAHKEEGK